jgi:hypothetical protein
MCLNIEFISVHDLDLEFKHHWPEKGSVTFFVVHICEIFHRAGHVPSKGTNSFLQHRDGYEAHGDRKMKQDEEY